MNNDHDPDLLTVFAKAQTELDDSAFTENVMRMIDHQQRNTLLVWSAFVIAVLACFALVAEPVLTALGMATELLPTSLVTLEKDWLSMLLAPLNSVAAALAFSILLLHRFYRRLFG